MTMSFDDLATRSDRKWSHLQDAIFDDVARGDGHTVVIARAGCGKTSTSVEAVARVPRRASVAMLAFNRSIAAELQQRAPAGVVVKTFHGFGLAAITKAFGHVETDDQKVPTIIRNLIGGVKADQRALLCKGVSLAKATLAAETEDVIALVDEFDLDVPEGQREGFATLVLRLLAACAEQPNIVDFDDMVWLPVVLGLRPRPVDRLFVDETQDLNKAQVELALSACPTGRICAVGDDRQAIYGWRGADPEAVPRLIERLGAKTLPLSARAPGPAGRLRALANERAAHLALPAVPRRGPPRDDGRARHRRRPRLAGAQERGSERRWPHHVDREVGWRRSRAPRPQGPRFEHRHRSR